MIEYTKGNLLLADAEALVNTVNCVGVMGKGIALQFKQAFPEMNKAYERACKLGEVVPGSMMVWETGTLSGPRYVINFPTKREWFRPSSYEDVQSGLAALVEEVKQRGIRSIAIPPLGCGNGGLDWAKVEPMILSAFAETPDVRVLVYPPAGAPKPREKVIKTPRPKLTRARALFIASIDRYSVLAYEVTLLEVQKLAYFLQVSGEALRLNYEAKQYGPYAENLNKVLEVLEGHYIHGFDGERSPAKQIELGDGASREATAFLASEKDAVERLNRVTRLIEGFETPYGMELLSSVHYVCHRDLNPAVTYEGAIAAVHQWNEHKRLTLKPDHIRVAFEHLEQEGWLQETDA